jgi:hypothetical protein
MIFKTRPEIKKQFDTLHNFGIKNLIVSGCSFTYNNHESSAVTWPYYLRDIGSFTNVYDCSLPGAGNQHIANSLLWALEIDNPDPSDSLVVVMWSGVDRDDYICPINKSTYPFQFRYSQNTMSGIAGGMDLESGGNTDKILKQLALTKDKESRSIENYLYFTSTYHGLKNLGYKFVFLNFLDSKLPSMTQHFDIKPYLPLRARQKIDQMMAPIIDPYEYAVKNDLLWSDDFHPSPDGHLNWTKHVLVPYLKTLSI